MKHGTAQRGKRGLSLLLGMILLLVGNNNQVLCFEGELASCTVHLQLFECSPLSEGADSDAQCPDCVDWHISMLRHTADPVNLGADAISPIIETVPFLQVEIPRQFADSCIPAAWPEQGHQGQRTAARRATVLLI